MSIIKNTLAVIGAVTVANYAVKGYKKYLAAPIENAITEAFDSEANRRHQAAYDATADTKPSAS